MINGDTIRRKLESPTNRIAGRIAAGSSDRAILSEVYLIAVCREPTAAEQAAIEAHLAKATNRRSGWEDVVWALVNSKEFLLRH